MKTPWIFPADAPPIEQSIHDYIVSIFRQLTGPERKVEIIPISPGAESTRGWDAAVNQVVPLYFQYKYPDFTSRPWSSQEIAFKQRQAWAFDDKDGLFHFGLRAKAKNAPKSQHELLYDLHLNKNRVFYVSPTFIDIKRLRSGGDPIYKKVPWRWGKVPFRYWHLLDYLEVPYFDGLICIPPHVNVSDPPESHQFYFNTNHETSLHSDPVIVESLHFHEVLRAQLDALESGDGITKNNVEEYIRDTLKILTKENDVQEINRYFAQNLSDTDASRQNPLMRNMRALAKILKKLYGIEMLLTIRRDL